MACAKYWKYDNVTLKLADIYAEEEHIMKQKKSLATKIYVTVIALMMVFALSSMAYAAVTYIGNINYYSYHYGYTGYSDTRTKSNNSSAVAYYESGAGPNMYVEMWASDGTSADAANYTLTHEYNGRDVNYYVVPVNSYEYIHNLVYETYGKTVYTKLKVYILGEGTVTGKWNPSIR